MLAALLVAGLVAGVLSTLILLAPFPAADTERSYGWWPWSRRLFLALIATGVLDMVVAAVLMLLNATRHNVVVSVAAVTIASLVWLPFTRRWSARGHMCWSSTVFLFAAYLAFMLAWTFTNGLPVGTEIGGLILWVLEVFAAFLGTAYLWELCDALGTEHWKRRVRRGAETQELHLATPF